MSRNITEFVGEYTSAVEASEAANNYEHRNWGYFGRAMVENPEPGKYIVYGTRSDTCD